MEKVILVNENDEVTGSMEKLQAHRLGLLHRAISVFVFNSKGLMLLQQRSAQKYHSPGLWTNTCCSHPRPEEDNLTAASRRLKEEMGLKTELHHRAEFIYKVNFDNGLTEHEYDHIFSGISDDQPLPNPDEADAYRWVSIKELEKELVLQPDQFTFWFHLAWDKLKSKSPDFIFE